MARKQDTDPSPTGVEETGEDEDITGKGGLAGIAPDTPPVSTDSSMVAYHGKATIRRITSQAWARAGIPDQGEAVWDRKNGWQLPVHQFGHEALALLRHDGSFAVP